LDRLKRELADAQEALGSVIESEDSLKEEFQSANEEILSANEELQSTNEELETSKEELQSANEELNTLNTELHHKNSELHELSNDISNLLNSTRIPLVMLDRGLRIRRVTPMADKLFKVVPSDIGRPIADIRLNIDVPTLEPFAVRVLESLQPEEREVQDLEGRWHSLSVLPYRTQDDKIDGVVLALQDISAVKKANEQLRKSIEFFRGVVNTVVEPLLVLDAELRVVMTNEQFLSTFKVSSRETVNRFLYSLGNEQWNKATLAHEINNPLQAVTNLMSLLGRSPRLDDNERGYAAMAEEELRRVVHLTQQSLSFYRGSTHPVAVDLDTILDGVLDLYAKRLQAQGVTVTKRSRSDGVTINSYPGEIRPGTLHVVAQCGGSCS
jgi:two-component system, chemotaxis family, CheB/CheR fusion protein